MAAGEDEIGDLIKEIAAKHHLSIGRDDPILVLQTINNRLLHNSARAQQEQLEAFSAQMEEICARWSTDAKAKADRALTAAVNAATGAALKVLQDSSAQASSAIRTEILLGTRRVSQAMKRARRLATVNVIAALITTLAIVVAFLGFWHRA